MSWRRPESHPKHRSEVLGLKGRNLKTLWRLDFGSHTNIADRRQAAVNSKLLDAYEAYRSAYLFDLNCYWPGLAALQQGSIALEPLDRTGMGRHV